MVVHLLLLDLRGGRYRGINYQEVYIMEKLSAIHKDAFWDLTVIGLALGTLTALLILSTGCTTTSGISYKSLTEYPDGTVKTEQVTVSAPSEPQGASFIESYTNGLTASVSGSQSASELAKVKGQQRNKGMLYGGCALLLLLGGVALALPNQLVSNKDAMIVLGAGMASMAVVMWVDASSGVMMYVLPLLIIGATIYIGWLYFNNKKQK